MEQQIRHQTINTKQKVSVSRGFLLVSGQTEREGKLKNPHFMHLCSLWREEQEKRQLCSPTHYWKSLFKPGWDPVLKKGAAFKVKSGKEAVNWSFKDFNQFFSLLAVRIGWITTVSVHRPDHTLQSKKAPSSSFISECFVNLCRVIFLRNRNKAKQWHWIDSLASWRRFLQRGKQSVFQMHKRWKSEKPPQKPLNFLKQTYRQLNK